MFCDTGECLPTVEYDPVYHGLRDSAGKTPGWNVTPSLLSEIKQEIRHEKPVISRSSSYRRNGNDQEFSWELPKLQESKCSMEIRDEGRELHIEHGKTCRKRPIMEKCDPSTKLKCCRKLDFGTSTKRLCPETLPDYEFPEPEKEFRPEATGVSPIRSRYISDNRDDPRLDVPDWFANEMLAPDCDLSTLLRENEFLPKPRSEAQLPETPVGFEPIIGRRRIYRLGRYVVVKGIGAVPPRTAVRRWRWYVHGQVQNQNDLQRLRNTMCDPDKQVT